MPFAEFQPSNAGDLLNEQVLRNAEFSMSLMDRAARNMALLQDVADRKQQYVDNHILSDQQIQANRRALAEMKRDDNFREARERTAVILADTTGRRAVNDASLLEIDEAAVRQAGLDFNDTLASIDRADSPGEMQGAAAAFHGKHGQLIEHPVFGPEYAALDRRLAARVTARAQLFASQARQIGDFLMGKIDATDGDAMAGIRRHPNYALARGYEPFADAYDRAEELRAHYLFEAQKLQHLTERESPPPVPAASPGPLTKVVRPLTPGEPIRYLKSNYIYLGETAEGQTVLRGADNQDYTVPHVLNPQR